MNEEVYRNDFLWNVAKAGATTFSRTIEKSNRRSMACNRGGRLLISLIVTGYCQ
jgi:hypothetical protein